MSDKTGTLSGIRTSCVTGESREVEVEYELRVGYDLQVWLYIVKGGVTGHESAPLLKMVRNMEAGDVTEWPACAGTPMKWDRLVITGASIIRAFETLET